MADYPYVYESSSVRAVGAGGARIRLFRRRRGGEDREEAGAGPDERAGRGESGWREVLEQAVAEFNASLQGSEAPFTCTLEEDDHGFLLRVQRYGPQGAGEQVEEELLDPADLPKWLSRLRSRLGILVDQSA